MFRIKSDVVLFNSQETESRIIIILIHFKHRFTQAFFFILQFFCHVYTSDKSFEVLLQTTVKTLLFTFLQIGFVCLWEREGERVRKNRGVVYIEQQKTAVGTELRTGQQKHYSQGKYFIGNVFKYFQYLSSFCFKFLNFTQAAGCRFSKR